MTTSTTTYDYDETKDNALINPDNGGGLKQGMLQHVRMKIALTSTGSNLNKHATLQTQGGEVLYLEEGDQLNKGITLFDSTIKFDGVPASHVEHVEIGGEKYLKITTYYWRLNSVSS